LFLVNVLCGSFGLGLLNVPFVYISSDFTDVPDFFANVAASPKGSGIASTYIILIILYDISYVNLRSFHAVDFFHAK